MCEHRLDRSCFKDSRPPLHTSPKLNTLPTKSFTTKQNAHSYKGIVAIAGTIIFFGLHNYLQEAIMSFPEFNYGWSLGFIEVFGVLVFSGVERVSKGEKGHSASLSSYLGMALCLLAACSMSNISLNYINYPTKVVFRSCKLIPTMLISYMYFKKRVSIAQFGAAIMVCAGLLAFAFADSHLLPSFNMFGIALVLASVCSDSFMPNLQERLMDKGVTRSELTFFTNLFTFIFLAGLLGFTGELTAVARFAWNSSVGASCLALYATLSFAAISFHMTVVETYGGVAAVMVGNGRKFLTVVLSFIMFPKPFSMWYAIGGALVLGGLTVSVITKHRSMQRQNQLTSPPVQTHKYAPVSTTPMIKGIAVGKIQPNAHTYHTQKCPTWTVCPESNLEAGQLLARV